MPEENELKVVSRRDAFLALAFGLGSCLAASSVLAQDTSGTAGTSGSTTSGGTHGMQRRQERRKQRHERREGRREGRHQRREERHGGGQPATATPAGDAPAQ